MKIPKWLRKLIVDLFPALLEWICPKCGERSKRVARYTDDGDDVPPHCLRCKVAMQRARPLGEI